MNPSQAVDVLEVIIEGKKIGAGFHCVSCDPNVVCWDGLALLPEPGDDPRVAVGGYESDRNEDDIGMVEKLAQLSEIFFEA